MTSKSVRKRAPYKVHRRLESRWAPCRIHDVPRSEYFTSRDGEIVIKYFFPEYRIAASVSAMLLAQPSAFTITALEDTTVLEYDFARFKDLVFKFPDVAAFHIKYMEQHWIIEKEPQEVSLRRDTAIKRYQDFVRTSPQLLKRVKQHHIAAYLGITPESLSRIRKSIADGTSGPF